MRQIDVVIPYVVTPERETYLITTLMGLTTVPAFKRVYILANTLSNQPRKIESLFWTKCVMDKCYGMEVEIIQYPTDSSIGYKKATFFRDRITDDRFFFCTDDDCIPDSSIKDFVGNESYLKKGFAFLFNWVDINSSRGYKDYDLEKHQLTQDNNRWLLYERKNYSFSFQLPLVNSDIILWHGLIHSKIFNSDEVQNQFMNYPLGKRGHDVFRYNQIPYPLFHLPQVYSWHTGVKEPHINSIWKEDPFMPPLIGEQL